MLLAFTQSQQSRRAPPTAHAPRHMPSNVVSDGSHVSRILRELGRSPATLLGTGSHLCSFNVNNSNANPYSLSAPTRCGISLRHRKPSFGRPFARGQLGVAFKRQVRIGNFIVDFLAPAVKLVVEWYGSQCTPR